MLVCISGLRDLVPNGWMARALRLIRYSGETRMNINYVLDKLDSGSGTTVADTTSPRLSLLAADQITVSRSKLLVDDRNKSGRPIIAMHQLALELNNFSLGTDGIEAQIATLTFCEDRGLCVSNFTSGFLFQPGFLSLEGLQAETAHSKLGGTIALHFPNASNTLKKTRLHADFLPSSLAARDIQLFVPALALQETLRVSGKVQSDFTDLLTEDFQCEWGDTYFSGTARIDGLTNKDSLFIDAAITRLSTHWEAVQELVPALAKKTVPEQIQQLQKVNYQGTFRGGLRDFTAEGAASTALGNLSLDLSLHIGNKPGEARYDGTIALQDFDLATFANSKKLGKLSCELRIEGHGLSPDTYDFELDGAIGRMDFNSYSYRNTSVKGTLARKKFSGFLRVDDPNLQLEFDGGVDFSGEEPSFDFISYIDHANLYRLNLVSSDTISRLTSVVELNFTGNDIDNFRGAITITSSSYETSANYYFFNDFLIRSQSKEGFRELSVNSDILRGTIKGRYEVLALPQTFAAIAGNYISAYKSDKVLKDQHLDFDFYLNNTYLVTDIVFPKLRIEPATKVSGHVYTDDKDYELYVDAPGADYSGNRFQHIHVEASAAKDHLKLESTVERIVVAGKDMVIDSVHLSDRTREDTSFFTLSWLAGDTISNNGLLNGYLTPRDTSALQLHLLSSELYLTGEPWYINGRNKIVFEGPRIAIDSLRISRGQQHLSIDGELSGDSSKQVSVLLENIDLDYVNPYLSARKTSLGGALTASATYRQEGSNRYLTSAVRVDSLILNKEWLGDLSFTGGWDQTMGAIGIDAALQKGRIRSMELKGTYDPDEKEDALDIQLSLSRFRLQALQSYVSGFMGQLRGIASGDLDLGGSLKKPVLTGDVKLQKTGFQVPFLNTSYNFEGVPDIHLEKNKILFSNLVLRDTKEKTRAVANGELNHDYFKAIDFDVVIDADSLLCLDTKASESSSYYGKAFTSGAIHVSGPSKDLVLNIDVKTEKGTYFAIPLTGNTEVSEHGFVTFVDHTQDSEEVAVRERVKLKGMEVLLNLEITPEAEVEIIFDELIGDVIKGRGQGDIRLEINTKGDFNMYGEYQINEGDYLFTLQNLINKKFEVANGGTISWNGSPYEARVDMKAIYHTRAVLKGFIEADTSGRRVPVELELGLTEGLLNPTIDFGIQLPASPEDVQSELNDKIQNKDVLNRQVFALLILNTFLSEDNGDVISTGVTANTTELLSHQLSNWISQISNEFDIGIKYTAAGTNDELSQEEVEFALSKKLLDDRVTVNGNVGVPLGQNQSSLVGDVEVEVNISEDGRFRAKAFNRSNQYDPSIDEQVDYTQGVGLFYREEFDNIGELWRKIFRREEEEEKEF